MSIYVLGEFSSRELSKTGLLTPLLVEYYPNGNILSIKLKRSARSAESIKQIDTQQQFERIQDSYVLPRCAAADIEPN